MTLFQVGLRNPDFSEAIFNSMACLTVLMTYLVSKTYVSWILTLNPHNHDIKVGIMTPIFQVKKGILKKKKKRKGSLRRSINIPKITKLMPPCQCHRCVHPPFLLECQSPQSRAFSGDSSDFPSPSPHCSPLSSSIHTLLHIESDHMIYHPNQNTSETDSHYQ